MLFVFNPSAGAGKLKNCLMEILCRFSAEGYELHVWPTTATGHARSIVKAHAAGMDMVVCCGGDGTLNEVVDGLQGLDPAPTVGYIPGGTTNDFAASLLLPKSNLLAAAERIIHPKKVFQCDVGSFNGRAFTYVAAFGAFTDVSYKTPQNVKSTLGYFAYLLEAVQRLPNLKPCKARVRCADGEYDGAYLLGMVTNSASVAGFHFSSDHRVRLDDGQFEVVLVKYPGDIAELGDLSASILGGTFSSPLLSVTRTDNMKFDAQEPLAWTLDGEFGGEVQSACIKVRPKALSICI